MTSQEIKARFLIEPFIPCVKYSSLELSNVLTLARTLRQEAMMAQERKSHGRKKHPPLPQLTLEEALTGAKQMIAKDPKTLKRILRYMEKYSSE